MNPNKQSWAALSPNEHGAMTPWVLMSTQYRSWALMRMVPWAVISLMMPYHLTYEWPWLLISAQVQYTGTEVAELVFDQLNWWNRQTDSTHRHDSIESVWYYEIMELYKISRHCDTIMETWNLISKLLNFNNKKMVWNVYTWSCKVLKRAYLSKTCLK